MYYDYSYGYGGGEMLGIILFYVIYLLVAGGFAIALYVLRSLGVYTIAKRRGLHHAWFAWVPVADQYLLGCISDQYQYVVKDKNKSRRKILLVLDIVYVVLLTVIVGSFVGIAFNAAVGYISESRMTSRMLGILGLYLPLLGVWIAKLVFRYMALYDLYVSVDPKNSTMYIVLSVIFKVTEPFFLFFNRNKDDGMPPRREPEPTVWEAPGVEEPWVNE